MVKHTQTIHRQLPVNIAKFLRTPILKNIWERLPLIFNSISHDPLITKLFVYDARDDVLSLIFPYTLVEQKDWLEKVFRKSCFEIMQQIYRRILTPKCDFNKDAKQLYWNRTSAWVFSCKFAAYFQNNFSQEHLQMAASVELTNQC